MWPRVAGGKVSFLFFLWWGDWTWLGRMALTHHDAGRWSQLMMFPAGSLAAGGGGDREGDPSREQGSSQGRGCPLCPLQPKTGIGG